MFSSQKHVFWQAFVLAVIVFVIGILLGFSLENYRTGQISRLSVQSETDLLDIQTQSSLLNSNTLNCSFAIRENINFANRIYDEAKLLEKQEAANQLTDDMIIQHRRYDLLRTIFWVNSVKLKENCNASFHNVVYLYTYNNPDLNIKAKQSVMSRILEQVKIEQGNNVMLIPIAADNNITSLNLLMNSYNVSSSELPVILIDEKTKITSLENKEQIESAIAGNSSVIKLN